MSERGSFVTEYIYCEKCFKAVGEALDVYSGRARLEPQVIAYRAYAGFIGGLYASEPVHAFEFELRENIEAKICHPVQIALMCDSEEHRAILTFTPQRSD